MTFFALAVDPVTNDLSLDKDRGLAVVMDARAIGQHIRQRLMTFEGEWFLDTEAGVPWLQEIMGEGFDEALAEAVIKDEILSTAGVQSILSFQVRFDPATRRLDSFDIRVLTDFDEVITV